MSHFFRLFFRCYCSKFVRLLLQRKLTNTLQTLNRLSVILVITMSSVPALVPGYVRTKIRPYFDENSLLLRAFRLPRSVFNMVNVFQVMDGKSSLVAQAYGYSTWILSKIWRAARRRALKNKEHSTDEGVDETKQEMASDDDYLSSNYTLSCVRNIYLHFLERSFLEITRQSLEVLRYERKVLQDLQDFEVVKALKGLFGCPSSDEEENEKKSEGKPADMSWTNMKHLAWTATKVAWTTLYHHISYLIPVLAAKNSSNKRDDPTPEESMPNPTFPSDSKETTPNCSAESSTNMSLLSAGTLLLCESNLLTQVLTDSGTYALESTQDLLKESLLLFVPMEILENTVIVLKNPTSLVSTPPLSALWELYNYVSIWGLDIFEECYNQPDIEYAVIDDEDFHFIVNVPRMKRPILFIGIR